MDTTRTQAPHVGVLQYTNTAIGERLTSLEAKIGAQRARSGIISVQALQAGTRLLEWVVRRASACWDGCSQPRPCGFLLLFLYAALLLLRGF